MHFIHELPPHSCSQHGPATAWLTLQWPREVTVIKKKEKKTLCHTQSFLFLTKITVK